MTVERGPGSLSAPGLANVVSVTGSGLGVLLSAVIGRCWSAMRTSAARGSGAGVRLTW
ncbi:hypothetical protein AB0O01_35790 [Streptomyces sp. NPDC093252]|uniref:hypothetical protein n=1 Tax=Streptomyces sp. NPDC093252 TaxID=3154980 RepID=UPI00343D9C24